MNNPNRKRVSAVRWWAKNKMKLSLAPAVIFWLASMLFFITGLQFKGNLNFAGIGLQMPIAIGLSLGITIIQIIGNEIEGTTDMNLPLKLGWFASYALGIGTNIQGLMTILELGNSILEWTVAISLGVMIEILPEYLFVKFLHSLDDDNRQSQGMPSGYHPSKPLPPTNVVKPRPVPPSSLPRKKEGPWYEEPTYHPIGRG